MITDERNAWLSQVDEPVLEPELEICDPHHHLWHHPEQAGGRYLLDELLADLGSGHRVTSTVFMECDAMYRADGPEALRPVGETEFVNGIAAMAASGLYGDVRACEGIVGFADLNLGAAVAEVLDAHAAVTPRFKGIRHAAGWDASAAVRNSHTNPYENMLLDARFREGFAQLAPRGLSFDAWLYHPQIDQLTDLARAFPDTIIIFDHFGGPLGIGPYEGKRDELFPVWKQAVARLAECPNVHAKLGGLVMAVNGFGFNRREKPASSDELVAATGDWYRHMLDCFGVERCFFESNFPVDRVSCSYRVLWNSFKKLAAAYGTGEKEALFRTNARRVYRLDP